jgi:hypothetical protein
VIEVEDADDSTAESDASRVRPESGGAWDWVFTLGRG